LAVLSILMLAAWLPLEAQQAAAAAQPSPAFAAANDSTKTAKPGHCSTTKCGADASGNDDT